VWGGYSRDHELWSSYVDDLTETSSVFEPVKSASRVLDLIELLTRSPEGMQFTDLLDATGWPRSSLHGLLRTMSDRGHLDLDDATGRYRIGLRLWEAGQAFLRALDLASVSRPHLERARDLINETVQLAILDGIENVYVAKVESSHHLRLQSEVGGRLPAYATGLGKVLLAGLPPVEFERRLAAVDLHPFTDATITDPDVLRVRLAEIRARGYGLDEGEYTVGVFCVAVPVRGAGGETVAAVSSSVPTVRASSGTQERMVDVLTETAARISADLGYKANV
jgi:DNA-binding IclR family transcriptional regulator